MKIVVERRAGDVASHLVVSNSYCAHGFSETKLSPAGHLYTRFLEPTD